MTAKDLTLAEWLDLNADELTQMIEFSKAPLPDDVGALHNELSRAQQEVGRAGAFLADVEAYLTGAEASATLEVRDKYPELTAGERRAMVKGQIKDLQKLADSLRVVVSAIKGKAYALMNIGRSH
jgi:hypothetical protein